MALCSEATAIMDLEKPKHKQADQRCAAWVKRAETLKNDRQPWDTQWQEIANFCLPGKANILNWTLYPNSSRETQLFTTTPHDAVITCAAGLLAWSTAPNERWGAWTPIRALQNEDAVVRWTADCSEELQTQLALSNFYAERHECLLNFTAFNTAAIYVTLSQAGRLLFKTLKTGSYVIANNSEGKVDTIYIETMMTARQMEQEFGAENLPETVAKCLEGEAKDQDKNFTVLHGIMPRPRKDRYEGKGAAPASKKAFIDVYFEKESKCVLREGGHDKFPVFCARWSNWETNEGTSVWGYGPGFSSLPECRQLNFIRKMMDVGMEKAVFPPIMAPDTWEGELDVSARGVNYYAMNQGGEDKVYPLNLIGDLRAGEAIAEIRKKAIEDKFHVGFFQMFAQADPKETATLTNAKMQDRLTQISPAFARLSSEMDNPMVEYLFELMMENGMLPLPPEQAIFEDAKGEATTPTPILSWTSRFALKVKALQNVALEASMGMVLEMAKIDPSALDGINIPIASRNYLLNNGVPVGWTRSEEEVQERAQARAEAQAQAMQMQMAEQASKAAANVGKAAPGLQEIMGQAA